MNDQKKEKTQSHTKYYQCHSNVIAVTQLWQRSILVFELTEVKPIIKILSVGLGIGYSIPQLLALQLWPTYWYFTQIYLHMAKACWSLQATGNVTNTIWCQATLIHRLLESSIYSTPRINGRWILLEIPHKSWVPWN